MVKLCKFIIYYFILESLLSCSPVPMRRLEYFNKKNHHDLPLGNGCYYYIYPRIIDGEYYYDNIHYKVFFENGLLKWASIFKDDTTSIEQQVRKALIQYKNEPGVWGTYKVINDTLFTNQIKSMGMAPHGIIITQSLIINDSSFIEVKRINEKSNRIDQVNNTYKFLKFTQLPDSTGYLYEKLQKRMRRNKN